MPFPHDNVDPFALFSAYMRITGVPKIESDLEGNPRLLNKRLGLLNGSSWITLWSNYFGREYLPEVQLVNVGNEAVQLNFMLAHERGEACPPRSNIEAFCRYARDLVELGNVDAILMTCSTMNRSYDMVEKAVEPYGVPVVQIDMPMMERAVLHGGKVLVIATHGPTVSNTQALLAETASTLRRNVSYSGILVEEAWHRLGLGDVASHNSVVADVIREQMKRDEIGCVVLAQLSMSVFTLSYPEAESEFGVPVLTSAQCGFEKMRQLLLVI